MRRFCAMFLFCTLALIPVHSEARTPRWWPCEPRSTGCPTYSHSIPVIDDYHPGGAWKEHRDLAMHWWNRCEVVHLFISHRAPFSPNTITLFEDRDLPLLAPYGGWSGTYGLAAFAEHWTQLTDVIAHEIGHALGLGHNRLMDSTMGNGSRVGDPDCAGLRYYYN